MNTNERLALVNLINRAKRNYFTTGYSASTPEALGVLISKFFEYKGADILRTAENALEDANYHTEAGVVGELADKYDPPFDPNAPIDDATRKALFARLREHYGYNLDDSARLAKVSLLAGKEIQSMSRRGNMTMGDARRVFDILDAV